MIATNNVAETVRHAFPFDVCKLPLSGPDNATTRHYGLFRDDTGNCVGVAVKRGYTPHTTDDVVALAEAAAEGFEAECEVKAGFSDGHKVVIGPTREHRRAVYGTTDNIFPRFILTAGYDGRAFSASLGMYRDLCDNLQMVTPTGESLAAERLYHTRQLRDRMPQLIETFRRLAGRWDSVTATVEKMQATTVDFAEFIRSVYPLAGDATRRSQGVAERRVTALVNRLFDERQRSGRPTGTTRDATAWEAYNVVTGYVQHDKNRKGSPNRFTRAMRALDDADCSRALQFALAS